MGPLELQCPLCCSETFSSHDSLKYHLLSIVDNILCPSCGNRFERILDLAEHVGQGCKTVPENSTSVKQEVMETEEDLEDSLTTTVLPKSILAKALMQKPSSSISKPPATSKAKGTPLKGNPLKVRGIPMKTVKPPMKAGGSLMKAGENLMKAGGIPMKAASPMKIRGTAVRAGGSPTKAKAIQTKTGATQMKGNLTKVVSTVGGNLSKAETHTIHMQEVFIKEEGCDNEETNGCERTVESGNEEEGNDEEYQEECDNIEEGTKIEIIQQESDEETVITEGNEAEETVKEGEEDMFYCSSCMVSFTSVNEHLEEYHEGQTVFIEDGQPSEEQPNDQEEDTNFYVVEGSQEGESFEVEDSNDSTEEHVETNIEYNTLKQEECIDKDGRLYTRKVVQIEKFWDDNKDPSKGPPVMLQYVLENGKAKKAEEFDLDNLTENQKLLVIYQCSTCNIHFSRLDQYERHKCTKTSNLYKCPKCDASFTTAKSVNAHMRLHKAEKGPQVENHGPHICETCNTEFPSYKSLRLHRRMHDPIKEKEIEPPVTYGIMGEDIMPKEDTREMFMCEICNNTYDKQYEEVHMKSHVEEENYDCRICNRKFFTQINLDMHMRVHSNGKKFSCSHCKKNFLTYETLQEHINSQCSNHVKMYECQYCGRRFVRPHEKVKHERIHTGEKPHICGICGKAFRVSYCLTLHMRTHSGTRPYQCATCGKRFKAHSVYNHHLLTHSNERNYKCPYCPKSFKTGVQLAGHKNSHIKPFTCTECNRPFASLYAVRAHMESHYRENNLKYNCSECGASYARAFALRDHIKAHHPGVAVDKVDAEILPDYEMVTEGIDASNTIIPVDESVLVQYEHATVEDVELVEEVTTDC